LFQVPPTVPVEVLGKAPLATVSKSSKTTGAAKLALAVMSTVTVTTTIERSNF
jgi:hypothetical protein